MIDFIKNYLEHDDCSQGSMSQRPEYVFYLVYYQ